MHDLYTQHLAIPAFNNTFSSSIAVHGVARNKNIVGTSRTCGVQRGKLSITILVT